ncbi:MAG: ParA family protein [Syntrophothermus sp.]|uniref:ParA family protein n=1 Tax=Syntrophothermus sp. TaxID=2736299 RepID=UPI00257E97A2|nr:ParA family protein [Syntrophothermus sp.]NSW82762.1 ParA family protein [Syntrophothermus sp.]
MAVVISVLANKGGVGKTVTATSIAAILSQQSKKVLLIDVDHQGSASLTFGFDPDKFKITTFDVMVNKNKIKTANAAIFTTEIENLYIMPANDDMTGLEFEVLTKLNEKYPNPFCLLRDGIAPIRDTYDYIVIDTPPSLGLAQGNALVASNKALVVFQTDYLPIRSTLKMIENIKMFIKHQKLDLEVMGILGTMYDSRVRICNQSIDELKKTANDIRLFKTLIPRTTLFSSMPAYYGKPAVLVEPNNHLVNAYYEFIKEAELN